MSSVQDSPIQQDDYSHFSDKETGCSASEWTAQGHKTSKWQSRNLYSGLSGPKVWNMSLKGFGPEVALALYFRSMDNSRVWYCCSEGRSPHG